MNCRESETSLDRQFDGDLTPDEAQALAAHVAGCEACTQTAERLAAEQRLYAQVASALHDRPPVWPGVRAAICEAATPARGAFWTRRRTIWLSAPALAIAALFVFFLSSARPDRSADGVQPPAIAGSNASSTRTAVLAAEERYLRAIDTVRQDVFAGQPSLPPATAESLTRGLTDLDAIIATAHDAWQTSPDDPLATRYLLSAYARKLELLMRHVTAS